MSPTFVDMGPVLRRPPTLLKKLWESLFARKASGLRPIAKAFR
ncbi:MAG: hypothetical protein QXZ62_06420 [Candidatus Caldarchaeum sp.]